jgi:hypothetical protein
MLRFQAKHGERIKVGDVIALDERSGKAVLWDSGSDSPIIGTAKRVVLDQVYYEPPR